jgi:hypothetical protein
MQLNPYLTFNGNCAAASEQNENVYVEIAKSERLAYKHVSEPQSQQESPR